MPAVYVCKEYIHSIVSILFRQACSPAPSVKRKKMRRGRGKNEKKSSFCFLRLKKMMNQRTNGKTEQGVQNDRQACYPEFVLTYSRYSNIT